MTDEEDKENEMQEGVQAEKSLKQTQLNKRKAVESVQKKAKTWILSWLEKQKNSEVFDNGVNES